MTTPIKTKYIFKIPVYWTAEQANEVFDFLAELQSAVFDAYENELTQFAMEQNQIDQHIEEEKSRDHFYDVEDNIPF